MPQSRAVGPVPRYPAVATCPAGAVIRRRASARSVPVGAVSGSMSSWAATPIRSACWSVPTLRLAGPGWEVPRPVVELPATQDFYFDAMAHMKMGTWSRGRVSLVGDAGYCASPLSGQGAELSLVGAYLLAGELSAAAGDYRVAFARYEQEMRPMVDACQKFAEGVGRWYAPGSKAMIRVRNLNVRALPYLPWRGLIGGAPQQVARTVAAKSYSA